MKRSRVGAPRASEGRALPGDLGTGHGTGPGLLQSLQDRKPGQETSQTPENHGHGTGAVTWAAVPAPAR